MRAAVLHTSPGRLEIEEVLIDEPRRHEVLVDVKATGLCHSDLHLMQQEFPLAQPTVLGHEAAGVVAAVGPDVTDFAVGDSVVTFPHGFCGYCRYCQEGRLTLCDQERLRRAPGAPPRLTTPSGDVVDQFVGLSTFAEQVLAHENMLVKVDGEVEHDRAALVGCGVTTGVGAVLRRAQVPPGATVAVIGCGGIGLNVIQGAVLAGAERIIAVDLNEHKLALASVFGATDVVDGTGGDVAQQVRDLLSDDGVDYSFEAVGSGPTYRLAVEVLRPGGTATMLGVALGNFELPMFSLFGERRVQGCTMGSVNFREEIPYLLRLYRAGRLDLDSLVSSRLTLDEINAGYDALAAGGVARSVVVF